MTPTQIITAARNKYNAIGDKFFSDDELHGLMTEASHELAIEAKVIERTFTTTSVASQQEYDYPDQAIAIKRVTYDGNKVKPISMREDDSLTLNNSTSTESGTPQFYFTWNEVIAFRPIPDSSGKIIKVWAFTEPQDITNSSTLEVPTRYHRDIVNFLLMEMCLKDNNLGKSQLFERRWDKAVIKAKRDTQKRKRGDAYSAVIEEESILSTILGAT